MTLRLRAALPGARQELASVALRGLRARKDAAEVAALLAAGQAIDRVHARVPGWLRPGRTEHEVAADISDAIVEEGHARVDFAIVGVRPERGQPAPRAGRPGAGPRRRGRGRHRRHDAERLLLGLHPHLRDRRAAAGLRRLLRGAAGGAGGRLRGGPAGRGGRGHRRRRPRADRRRRVRRVLHPPDRARHRPGDPRGSLHRVRQRRAAGGRATRSPSSRASTRVRTGRGSRTSWCAPTTGVARLNNGPRDLVIVDA